QRVDVIGRVVAHPSEIEAFEQVERSQQHRALQPEADFVNFIAAIAHVRRLVNIVVKSRQSARAHQPAHLLHSPADAVGYRAAIEIIYDYLESRTAAPL